MALTVISSTADGIIAALLAPFFMTIGFFIWDVRWTSSGGSAFALNLYKCNFAAILFAIMVAIRGFYSSESTTNVFTVANVGFLVLSSTLGIFVGDILWLEALRLLGAKHVIVVDSLKPFAVAILGRLVLDEELQAPTWGGMVLTVIGVGVVAWEEQRIISKRNDRDKNPHATDTKGNTSATHKGSCGTKVEGVIRETKPPSQTTVTVSSGDVELLSTSSDHATIRKDQRREPKNVDDFDPEEFFHGDIFANNAVTNQQTSKCITNQSQPNLDVSQFKSTKQKKYKRGYICAISNVLADSLGSVLTKKYGLGMTTWSINLIRFGFAGVMLLFISISMRSHQHCLSSSKQHRHSNSDTENCVSMFHINNNCTTSEKASMKSLQKPLRPQWYKLPPLTVKGWLQITSGVALVTFLQPALTNFAIFQIALGLAISLGSIGPLYGLILDWPFKGERPTVCGAVGAFLAVGGVVILCVWGP